jgi:hypothetical protein
VARKSSSFQTELVDSFFRSHEAQIIAKTSFHLLIKQNAENVNNKMNYIKDIDKCSFIHSQILKYAQ